MVKKKSFEFILTVSIVVILDQLTKYLITNYTSIDIVTNTGSLFGLFKGSSQILIWFSVFVIGIFFYNYENIQNSNKLIRISSGMIVGGAFGNLIDRAVYKAVIDFINLGWWPSFNLADSAISIGVFLLILALIKKEIKHMR